MTPLETIAVVMAIGYLVLAIRENIWCWFCAGVSTACYIWVTFVAKLYMDAALQVLEGEMPSRISSALAHGDGCWDQAA